MFCVCTIRKSGQRKKLNSCRLVLISKHSKFDHLQVLGLLDFKQGYLVVEAPVAGVALASGDISSAIEGSPVEKNAFVQPVKNTAINGMEKQIDDRSSTYKYELNF